LRYRDAWGLPEDIVRRAEEHVGTESSKFEEVLDRLESERRQMEKSRASAEELQKSAEELRSEEKKRLSDAEKEAEALIEGAKRRAQELVGEAKSAAEEAFTELSELRKKRDAGGVSDNLSEARALLRGKLNAAEKKAWGATKRVKAPPPSRPLRPGDLVELIHYGSRATVISEPDESGNMALQAGILKISANVSEVRLLEGEAPRKPELSAKVSRDGKTAEVHTELDLRGKSSDEALLELDRFIDGAIMTGLHTVTVIHGKGTGVLRAAVHEHLKKTRQIKSFRLGKYGEGENGVTIVEI